MRRYRRTLFSICTLAFAFLLLPFQKQAQAQDMEAHPAYQVVLSYLTYAMGQDWPKSAALIDKNSLEGLRDRYVERISRARTLQEELDMCRALDCANTGEVKALDPTDFYIRYHKGVQKRFPVSQEKLDGILKSKKMKPISLGEETNDGTEFAHVLVRTRHKNGTKIISSLELISLLKINGKWMVTLDAMRPLIRDDSAGAGASSSDAKK